MEAHLREMSSVAEQPDFNSDDQLNAKRAKAIADLMGTAQYDQAAQWCARQIADHPDDHVPYLHLGKLAELAGDYQKSAEFLAEAIVRDASCGEAFLLISRMFRKIGKLPYAARSLQVALDMKAAGPDGWLDLADMSFEMGDREGARAACIRVLELNPGCSRSTAILKLVNRPASNAAIQPVPTTDKPAYVVWDRVHLSTIAPDGYPHWRGISDTVQSYAQSFTDLGIDCTSGLNQVCKEGRNILFGAHLIQSQEVADRMPAGTIIFNLEQIAGIGLDRLPVYKSLLNRLSVWDYSRRNIESLKLILPNVRVSYAGIGYAACMTRIPKTASQTTDVLFYGSLNERRAAVLDALRATGMNVKHLFNIYGSDLDAEVANAKVVLNMHYYEDSIHEIVRTSYLLANSKAIVSECNANTEIEADLARAMRVVPYAELAAACTELVADDSGRWELQNAAFEIFSHRLQKDLLKEAISATA